MCQEKTRKVIYFADSIYDNHVSQLLLSIVYFILMAALKLTKSMYFWAILQMSRIY